MGRFVLATLLCGLVAPTAAAEIYDYYIELGYNKTDKAPANPATGFAGGDNNGKLNLAEFNEFVRVMDLENDLGASDFNTADANNDGEVTETELVNWIEGGVTQELQDKIIQAISGVPDFDNMVSSVGEVSTAVATATSFVVVGMTLAEDPDNFMPGDVKLIKTALINTLECGNPSVSCTWPYLTLDDTPLTLLSGSTVLELKAFYPDDTSANSAKTNVETALPTASAASTALGHTVTAAPTVVIELPMGSGDLDVATPGAFGAIAVLLIIASCCLGRQASSSRRKLLGAPSGGCCSCCSAYALKGWATSTMIAVVFLLVTAFILFQAMVESKDAIKCILDQILALQNAASPDAQAAVADLEDTLTIIDQVRAQVDNLPLAVIMPACLAAVMMTISSACECRDSSSMCCAKIFMLISHLLLVLCIVFYAIFASLGPIVQQPAAKEMLGTITGLCETTQPLLQQTLQDVNAALNRALATPGVASAEITDYQDLLVEAQEPVDIFVKLCDCVGTLFDEFVELFAPAASCIAASVFALFVSLSACCSAQCCCSPKVTSSKGSTSTAAKVAQSV